MFWPILLISGAATPRLASTLVMLWRPVRSTVICALIPMKWRRRSITIRYTAGYGRRLSVIDSQALSASRPFGNGKPRAEKDVDEELYGGGKRGGHKDDEGGDYRLVTVVSIYQLPRFGSRLSIDYGIPLRIHPIWGRGRPNRAGRAGEDPQCGNLRVRQEEKGTVGVR